MFNLIFPLFFNMIWGFKNCLNFIFISPLIEIKTIKVRFKFFIFNKIDALWKFETLLYVHLTSPVAIRVAPRGLNLLRRFSFLGVVLIDCFLFLLDWLVLGPA